MKGKRITKSARIMQLAKARKSIWHSHWGRTVPAAIIQNMPFQLVVGFLRMGWIYEYKPKKK